MSERGDNGASYRQVVAGLLEDGEQFAKARMKLYRAIVFYRISQARKSAFLIGAAVLVAAAALVALLMAIVFALAQTVGPLWAGVIVAIFGLGVAGLLGYWGVKTFPDLDEKLFEDDEFDVAPTYPMHDKPQSHEPRSREIGEEPLL